LKIALNYGLFRDEEGFSERANVLIDEAGNVLWVKVYPIPKLLDISEVFNACCLRFLWSVKCKNKVQKSKSQK